MATQADSGIYEIVNTANGKRYVGSASNLRTRKIDHFKLLRRGSHHSRYLQASFNKHGGENFEFRILELVSDRQDLVSREQHHIDTLKPEYNIARVAGSCLGVRHTAEAKAKMSEKHKGKKLSPETIAKMVESRKGYQWSPETREKMMAAIALRSADPEYRAKLSEIGKVLANDPQRLARLREVMTGRPSPMKGKKRDPAIVEKTAAAHRGRKRSPETRAKISAKAKGRPFVRFNDDYREKLSAASKGKALTPEHLAALQRGRAKHVCTEAERAQRSASLRAAYESGRRTRQKSPEHRAKIAATLTGRKATSEARANQSAAQIGKKRGPYKQGSVEGGANKG